MSGLGKNLMTSEGHFYCKDRILKLKISFGMAGVTMQIILLLYVYSRFISCKNKFAFFGGKSARFDLLNKIVTNEYI